MLSVEEIRRCGVRTALPAGLSAPTPRGGVQRERFPGRAAFLRETSPCHTSIRLGVFSLLFARPGRGRCWAATPLLQVSGRRCILAVRGGGRVGALRLGVVLYGVQGLGLQQGCVLRGYCPIVSSSSKPELCFRRTNLPSFPARSIFLPAAPRSPAQPALLKDRRAAQWR